MKKRYLFFLFYLISGLIQAQYYPQYKQTVTYNLDSSSTFTNYQIRLEVNTAALVSAGQMQADGDDIRFGLSSCDTNLMYHYYIESGMNSTATIIWVKIPSITGQTTDSMFMYYGDSSAANASDFNTTFPNSFISNGNTTVSGTGNFDWFEVRSGDTIFIDAQDSTVQLYARNVIIKGAVWGKGSGYAPASSNPSNGTGIGAGSPSSGNNSGAGGGAYGGNGGKGCYDNGDSPGVGGTSYGTDEGDDINMGSSGANSTNTKGGAGGGMLMVNATWVYNNGTVNFDGNPGALPGGSNGGGGGAGGGIKVVCKHIINDSLGRITAIGGQGSDGTNAANDGGGGGGGGRLKFFCETYARIGDSILAYGGRPGINGGVKGDYGDSGTVRFIPTTFYETFGFGQTQSLAGSISAFSCGNYTSPSGKYTWTATGKYVDILTGSGSCDSVLLVDLTVVQGGNDSIAVTTCNSYTLPSGKVVTTTNVYYDTIPLTGGCDSVHIVNLTVNYSSSANINISACNSYILPKGNQATTSGVYIDTIANATGCDSIITINLTINNSTTSNGAVSACYSYKLANGSIITTSGTYTDSLLTSSGCDSIVTVDITILNGSSSTISPAACGSYTLPKGKVVTSSGTYIDTLMNASGCDSIITLNVTINTVDTAITVSGNTITATLAGANYQWINCSNSSAISGATSQSYTATASGSYAVIITSNSCVDTSRCVNVIMAGIDAASYNKNLNLYPNPTNGVFNVQIEESAIISIVNILGVELLNRQLNAGLTTLDLSGQPAGVYFIRVKSGNSYMVKEIVLTK